MSKFVRAAIASAFVFAAVVPNTVSATPLPPVIVAGTSGAAGAAATGGFIGFVGLLVTYDLIRRTSCSGDFLGLGGPGFTSPITPAMSIITPPTCGHVPKARHRKH
jgi:hypothetical protein